MASRTPINAKPGYLTVVDCAERLGMTARTLRRHMNTATDCGFEIPRLYVTTVKTGRRLARFWEANWALAWYVAGEPADNYPDLVRGLGDAFDADQYEAARAAVQEHIRPAWMKSV